MSLKMEEIVDSSHPERLRYLNFLHCYTIYYPFKEKNVPEQLYEKIISQRTSNLSLSYKKDAIANLVVKEHPLNQKPRLYCAFHIGCYRLISRFLLASKIKHTIIMNIINTDDDDEFTQIIDTLNEGTEIINYINISKKDGLLKLRNYVKDGRSVLIYIDANLSAADYQNYNKEEITFLNTKIKVITGAAYISKKFKLPIIPTLSLSNNQDSLIFLNEISPDDSATNIMQVLWNELETFIIQYPDQWEGWLFAGNFKKSTIPQTTGINKEYYIFNNKDYRFINTEKHLFSLYNIKSNQIIQINNEKLYKIIETISKDDITIKHDVIYKVFSDTLINTLIQNQVFV